eukprot:NODE_765_length_4403_cov_0.417054.p2 type:complete len:255 gc:universal NODE_765_length_4403_cov_0.417054:3259-2495(-)
MSQMHTQFEPLPSPEYKTDKNREKQLQSHLQKLKKQFPNKAHKKLINKAKEKWESELNDAYHLKDEPEVSQGLDNSDPKRISRQEKRLQKKKAQQEEMLIDVKNELKIDYKQNELTKLSAVLLEHGLKIENMREIQGNGDCLFSSVVHELEKLGINEDVKKMRMNVVTYIKCNITEFQPFYCEDKDINEYLSEMLINRWGGHLELIAISNLYKVNVNVFSIDGLSRVSTKFTQCINLVYLKHFLALGEHYNCFK